MYLNQIGLATNTERKPKFKGGLFDAVANIESNTLLNRGIVDIGGFVVPQAVMANNKDESFERVFKSLLYFAFTFVSPLAFLPLINKHALKSSKIISALDGDQKRILEMSKKYLAKDANYMKEGIQKTAAELFKDKNKFNPTLEKYSNPEDLRQALIKSHKKVLFADFLITNSMVAAIPWLGNFVTKLRTHRSGYSGSYNLADEEFTKKMAQKHDKHKRLRQAATIALAVLPAIVVPSLLGKGLMHTNKMGKISNWFNKNAQKFDYTNAIYMSRLTALIMWVTSDYFPYQLACRDKYEYRDTVVRGTSIGLLFWGGDLVLKNIFSKTSDKFFGTNLMNKESKQPYKISELKKAENIEALKNLSPKVLAKTKNAAVGLYGFNLAIIMGALGFGLPYVLNKLLKRTVKKDINADNK